MNAREYAENAHGNQTRWDGSPYIIHPDKLVSILKDWKVTDQYIIDAAYLHDVVEDTTKTISDIEYVFGAKTASLVKELSFPPNVTPEEYMKICTNMSKDASLIKITDILANLTDNGTKSYNFVKKRLLPLTHLIHNYYNKYD